jgi:hypothetical protein
MLQKYDTAALTSTLEWTDIDGLEPGGEGDEVFISGMFVFIDIGSTRQGTLPSKVLSTRAEFGCWRQQPT